MQWEEVKRKSTTDPGIVNFASVRPAIYEAERFVKWFIAQVVGEDVPRVTITIQTKGQSSRNGHFFPEIWSTKEGDLVNEINLSAERLQDDPIDIMETLSHECVHLWCKALEIKDCSNSGRHNAEFRDHAESVGLIVEKGKQGWNSTSLGASLQERIEQEFVPDYEAFSLFRTIPEKKPARKTTRAWECGCTTIRSAAKAEVEALCTKCEQPFKEKE